MYEKRALGLFSPDQSGELIGLFIYLKRITEKMEPDSSQWCVLKRQEPSHNKGNSHWEQGKKIFGLNVIKPTEAVKSPSLEMLKTGLEKTPGS